MVLFNVTYEIVTHESAELGDYAESGFLSRDVSLRDAIAKVQETRTNQCGGVECVECDSWPAIAPRWITVTNGAEFMTGAVESRSLHIPVNVAPSTARRIARLLGAYGVAP